ncbi:MAG TPA: YifB family Mg chelatase-like AAA ATPase [Lacipirellulaceae bacterium]|nr:YifB family Mg chelatase-like AAA ATPase [Lacipirellulaceae bacterium]
MLAKLHTFSLLGIDALPVEVEVDVSPGALPKTVLVGLPEQAVKESTHRIERALVNSGFVRPQDRVVINLAPAELPKSAGSFDLPIAVGILAGSGQLKSELFDQYAIVGELALDGSTRPVKGALSMAMAAAKRTVAGLSEAGLTRSLTGLKEAGYRGLIVPAANAAEAAVVEDIDVIAVESLSQTVGFLTGELEIEPTPSRLSELFQVLSHYEEDFADVRGQEMAKRAVTIAAAGGHNLLMVGPPGSGKTMLAKRVPTILPVLSADESIETTRIYSAVGRLPTNQPLLARRPFRAPHHTISNAGLVGGGSTPTPGEISLAHNGVLFLDELPEFNRTTLEVLRQPLEDGHVTISRALNSTTFPANFVLIASLNPCPCGYRNDPRRECHCTVPQIERYMAKISGPLLDRIDLHIEVPAVPFKELSGGYTAGGVLRDGTTSAVMRDHVMAARAVQEARFLRSKTRQNAKMSTREIRQYCQLSDAGMNLLRSSIQEMGLSARAHDKILRVARTIADLDGSAEILPEHLSEAVNYRMLDRQFWS